MNTLKQLIEKQKEIAAAICDDYLCHKDLILEITNCFDKLINAEVENEEITLNDVEQYLKDHDLKWQDTETLLEAMNKEDALYWSEKQKDETDDIVIRCDNLLQREKIKEFLETEIFTDVLRYNAAVDSL